MRLIIVCLCLCSGVSLIAFSRAGFPEDPLRILGSPRPAADREAKDQARFARLRLQRSSAVETSDGAPMPDDATRNASLEEPARTTVPAPEAPVDVLPLPVPAPTNTVEPAREGEPPSGHHPVTIRTRLRPVRMPRVALKRRVLLVRAAVIGRPAKASAVNGVRWSNATPPKDPGSLSGIP